MTTTLMHLLTVLLAITAPRAAPAKLHEVARFKLGGDGGWDTLTVDAAARRLYIARADRVMVADADSGAMLGEVAGLDGAHAVVIVKELAKGFATSGKTGEVVAFDLESFKITGRVHAGDNPDLLLYDSFSKRLFSFNGKSKDVAVIDPANLEVAKTIALEGKPEFAVSDGEGRVFVNLEDRAVIAELSSRSFTVTTTVPLKPCEDPSGLAYAPSSHTLIVGCGNKRAVVVDAKTGKLARSFKAGDGIDGVAFDSERRYAYVSAGEGLLTILKEGPKGFSLEQTVKTVKGARTLAVDAKSGHVFLPSAKLGLPTAPAAPGKKPRPSIVPGSFFVLVYGR